MGDGKLGEELDSICEAIKSLHNEFCEPSKRGLRPDEELQELLRLREQRERPQRAPQAEPEKHQDRSRCTRCCEQAAAALPLLLSLPFYVCASFDEWYIDEMFALYNNGDLKPSTPYWNLLVNDFWGNSLWPKGIGWTHKSFRPLITLSFKLELVAQSWYGLMRPGPMRFVSCAVHSLNVVLLQLLLGRLCQNRWWVLLAACLFALHPVHLENLPYLVGRADSLATSFLLAAALLRARTLKSKTSYWHLDIASLLVVPAGLAKETGFALPAVLAWWGLLHGLRISPGQDLAILAAAAALRCWYVGGTNVGFSYVDTPVRYLDSWLQRGLSYNLQHAKYGQLLVLPWNQSWDYSFDALPLVRSLSDVRLLFMISTVLTLAACTAWGAARRSLRTLLGLGFIFIPFLPFSNIPFLVGTTVAERLLYPCTVGWSLLVAAVGSFFEGTKRPHLKMRSLAVVLALLYGYRAGVRTWQWRTKVSLYAGDFESWSRSAKVTHQFALCLHGGGQWERAIVQYQRSLDMHDDNALTDYGIAQCLLQLGRYPEAGQRFEKILKGHGIGIGHHNKHVIYLDYGWLLARIGRFKEAIPVLEEGLELKPDTPHALNALGIAKGKLGDFHNALGHFLAAIELRPNSAVLWSNTAALAAIGGALEQAAQAAQNALSLDPEDPVVTRNSRIILSQARLASTKGGPQFLDPLSEQPALTFFLEMAG